SAPPTAPAHEGLPIVLGLRPPPPRPRRGSAPRGPKGRARSRSTRGGAKFGETGARQDGLPAERSPWTPLLWKGLAREPRQQRSRPPQLSRTHPKLQNPEGGSFGETISFECFYLAEII